jgi:hypothetical protein
VKALTKEENPQKHRKQRQDVGHHRHARRADAR